MGPPIRASTRYNKNMFNLFKKKTQSNNSLPLADKRRLMISFLQNIVVPEIKKNGFFGTFPHFRKKEIGVLGFVSFQFNRYGGSFVVEVGKAKDQDLGTIGQGRPFEKLDSADTKFRKRINPQGITGDYWFSYEQFINDAEFKQLAESVVVILPQVDEFLQNGKFSYSELKK